MKLIVLDRDGVVNEDSDAYIKHPDEWHPVPGSLEAIAKLKQAGWTWRWPPISPGFGAVIIRARRSTPCI